MVETQVTKMVIKVDLGCEKCHKKIKRVLCAIPQIQNQAYDKKENKVTITVVCCCPEKIKKNIYCKGGEAVKCIEIIKPTPKAQQPKSDPQPQPQTQSNPPPQTQTQPQPDPPPQTQTQPQPDPPPQTQTQPQPDPPPQTQTQPQPDPPPQTQTQPQPDPHNECPTPRRTCCAECYHGISGGPCYQASGRPTRPCDVPCGRPTRPCDVPCGRPTRPCDVPCGRPVCDIWAVGGCSCRSRGYYVCRCEYVYEDYPPACKMM